MRGAIVVGTDGSETSRLAVEEAGAIARASGRQLVVLFVRHVSFAGVGVLATGGLSAGAVQDALDGDQALAEAQCIAILDPSGVRWRFEVGEGDPASELMRVATGLEADTIVVAGRRHGALGGPGSCLGLGAPAPPLVGRPACHPPEAHCIEHVQGGNGGIVVMTGTVASS